MPMNTPTMRTPFTPIAAAELIDEKIIDDKVATEIMIVNNPIIIQKNTFKSLHQSKNDTLRNLSHKNNMPGMTGTTMPIKLIINETIITANYTFPG